MTNSEIADHIVSNLGGDEGFWNSSTEDTIFNSAFELLECGFNEHSALVFISNLVSAIREEYGE